MATRVWEMGLFLFLIFGGLTWAEPSSRVSSSSSSSSSSLDVCLPLSITDSILRFRDFCAASSSIGSSGDFVGVTEGDDVSLQKVLNLVHKNTHEYVAVLFYASWCPFSRTCRPAFAILSSLYPAISHFAFEESVVRPSILSRYGVHGFPTLFLINSTMRVRYHGSRTIGSLIAFYNDVTGMKPVSLDRTSLEKIGNPSNLEEFAETEPENCPFSWARSPENLLRQETYLALATMFVLLRLLYFLLPAILAYASSAWRRHIRNASLMSLWEHPLAYLGQAMQVFKALKEPCKRSNLQERAMNARSWASKSLVSVSLGEASSSRGSVGNERR